MPELGEQRLELLGVEALPEAGQRGAEDRLVLFREFSQHGQPLFALAAFEEKAGRPHARRGARFQVALEFLFGFRRVAVPEQDETVGTCVSSGAEAAFNARRAR